MSDDGIKIAFDRLLKATTTQEIEPILQTLEGVHGGTWRDLGDRECNFPTVHISGNSSSSAVERITNSIDATLEAIISLRPEMAACKSPRELVEKAFDVPDGYLGRMESKRREILADNLGIVVTTLEGDSRDTPTIDFRDSGVGLTAAEFPNTIVSLNRTNKIRKWYLMGRFGQGGSTTYRFCKCTTIISKKKDESNPAAAFTIVKYKAPDAGERDGRYVYLVGPDKLPFQTKQSDGFPPGTLVRHIDYGPVKDPSYLRVYSIWEQFLFDPVLPFEYIEGREGPNKGNMRRISGSRSRLANTDYLEFSDEHEVPLPALSDGKIIIRYWLLKPGAGVDVVRTFVDPGNPLVITYLGQTQDVLPRNLISNECKLGYLDRHLIVQIDCENLTDEGRRKFFTSTRERITEDGLGLVTEAVIRTLKEDEDLRSINESRKLELLRKSITKEAEKMRQKLAEMINRIRPGTFKVTTSSGVPEGGGRRRRGTRRTASPPLPTGPFPTYVKIANHEDPIDFVKGEPRRLVLHSDAPDGFMSNTMWQAALQFVGSEPLPVRLVVRHRDFKGGRLHISAQVSDQLLVGAQFDFTLQLKAKNPNGDFVTFSDTRKCVVEKSEATGPETPRGIDAPTIHAVTEGDEVWVRESFDQKTVAMVKESASGTDIFVSLGNEYYVGTLSRASYEQVRIERLKNQYLLHVALHSYLQHVGFEKIDSGLSEDLREKMRQDELERASRTILTALTSEQSMSDSLD